MTAVTLVAAIEAALQGHQPLELVTDDALLGELARRGRWILGQPDVRIDVEIVESGTHTDEFGVVRGAVTLWGSVDLLAGLAYGPAVLELRR